MNHHRLARAVAMISGTIALYAGPALAGSCPTDLNGDDATGFSDLTAMLNSWGPCPACPEDVDGDGAVGFSDLTQLLNNWGPCPIDVFEYPAYYEDLFVVEVGLQFLGSNGPLVLSEPQYNRVARDIALMEAARPEITDAPHLWRWAPFHVLMTYDTTVPRDELEAVVAYYQGEIYSELVGGSILFLDFPMGGNPWALTPILAAAPGAESAEVDGVAGAGPFTNRWEPTDAGGGAVFWKIVVGWENGGQCPANGACDCFSTYEFLITANGTLTLLDLTSTPSPFGAVSDCTGYPPAP